MQIESEMVVLFLGMFAGLVGFVGISITNKLESIDEDLKELLISHSERLVKVEKDIDYIHRAGSVRHQKKFS